MHILSRSRVLFILTALLLGACALDYFESDDGTGSDTDIDIDTDTDMDTDTDTDADAGLTCDPAGDAPCCGEVQQSGTDLYWSRCPLGQSWEQGSCSCSGTATPYEGNDALAVCPSGYRLPTRQEFVDLLGNCDSAVIGGDFGTCDSCDATKDNASVTCTDMFESDIGTYWSSTAWEDQPGFAWIANLAATSDNIIAVPESMRQTLVRCVRP